MSRKRKNRIFALVGVVALAGIGWIVVQPGFGEGDNQPSPSTLRAVSMTSFFTAPNPPTLTITKKDGSEIKSVQTWLNDRIGDISFDPLGDLALEIIYDGSLLNHITIRQE